MEGIAKRDSPRLETLSEILEAMVDGQSSWAERVDQFVAVDEGGRERFTTNAQFVESLQKFDGHGGT